MDVRRKLLLGVAVLATLATVAAPAGAVAPRPLTDLPITDDGPVTPIPLGDAGGGRVFLIRPYQQDVGVRQANGAVAWASSGLSYDAEVGPDGRLWGTASGGLVAVAADLSRQAYPLPTPDGGSAPSPFAATKGVDGRVWFIDRTNHAVGAVDVDGTDAASWPVAGIDEWADLTAGPDGRMWLVRVDGTVAALTPAGTVAEVGGFGGRTHGIATFAGELYALVGKTLVALAPDGTKRSVVAADGATDLAVASGRLWVYRWASGLPGSSLLSVAGDGATTFTTPIPTAWSSSIPDPFSGASFVSSFATLTPTNGGTGLIGSSIDGLWRWDGPAPGPVLTAASSIVHHTGYDALRVSVTAKELSGLLIDGSATIALWGSNTGNAYQGNFLRTRSSTVALRQGKGVVEIPIVPSMLTWSQFAGAHSVRGVSVEIRASGGQPGVSSPVKGTGALPVSHELGDVMHIYAFLLRGYGLPYGPPSVSDSGALYWAKQLGAGTPRLTVARSVVSAGQWREQRVRDAYAAWMKRQPTGSERAYWAQYLTTHTPKELDLKLAGTVAARDAGGTSSYARATHLAQALGTDRRDSYLAQFNAGSSWTRVMQAAYSGGPAIEARADRILGPLQMANTTTTTTRAKVISDLTTVSDERLAIVRVASTLR